MEEIERALEELKEKTEAWYLTERQVVQSENAAWEAYGEWQRAHENVQQVVRRAWYGEDYAASAAPQAAPQAAPETGQSVPAIEEPGDHKRAQEAAQRRATRRG